MNDKFTQEEQALRQALEHLPAAPPDPTFASRVMARAAVTPQCNAAGALAARAADLRPATKFAWAMAGFSLGVAIFLSIFVNTLNFESGHAITASTSAPRPAITQSILVFDPLEASLGDNLIASGSDRR